MGFNLMADDGVQEYKNENLPVCLCICVLLCVIVLVCFSAIMACRFLWMPLI